MHLDLMREGRIPDPFYRDNEHRVQWVGEADWTYMKTFEADAALREAPVQRLSCEGLDTLAEVRLNGNVLGRTENMFREWFFEVAGLLQAGENRLEITFRSPLKLGEEKQEEFFLWHTGIGHHRLNGGNWFRKEQCNFGWDWGPMLPTCGIWKRISLVGWEHGRLGRTRVAQHHENGMVRLELDTDTEVTGGPESAQVRYRLELEGEKITEAVAPTGEAGQLQVKAPRLWWPNGLGEQPLYTLTVELLDEDGRVTDKATLQIGLRDLRLIQEEDAWGQSFCFSVNGHRFFAKGANWIPAHVFDGAIDEAKLEDLLQSAAEANMNMLRVWGGGKYECDRFYEICDRKGLLIWQDFMFGCSAYPAHEPAFMENVREEVDQQIRRIQHHACLALWCGNNELEQIEGIIGENREGGEMSWEDYKALFDDLIGGAVARLDPGRSYIPSSEFSPLGDREDSKNPNWGDAHLWAVWHGREPFEWYRTSFHRFCSEFGFQSFPHPETVKSYTLPEERNITSYVMEHHQRSPIGNSAIIDYVLSWFRLPVGWKHTVWLSQVVQAYAIKYAVEHWRRNMPRCMGAIYWQLNDCWPVASWASLDSSHRWKALHYEAKKFFEPVHLSLVEDSEKGMVEVHLSNDRLEAVEGEWSIELTSLRGTVIGRTSGGARVPPGSTAHLETVNLESLADAPDPRDLLIWGFWKDGDGILSRNLATLVRPKRLPLPDPRLAVEVADGEVKVTAEHPALFVWLESDDPDVRFSDNFFHLRAGEARCISRKTGSAPGPLRAFSLFDTYQE